MSSQAVSHAQRFTKAQPCPICQGYAQAPRGQGVRCFGFLSDDGAFAHCTREEHAGSLPLEDASLTYAHKLTDNCRCGVRHDPSPPQSYSNGHKPRIAKTYDYTDAQGRLLYQVVRMFPKDFWARRPDGHGGWIKNLTGVRAVLYHLPEVLEAIAQEKLICIAEGEDDVDVLRQHGYIATCNHGGAQKWHDHHSQALQGPNLTLAPSAAK